MQAVVEGQCPGQLPDDPGFALSLCREAGSFASHPSLVPAHGAGDCALDLGRN